MQSIRSVLLPVLALACLSAVPQDTAKPQAAPTRFVLEPGDHEIPRLLEAAAKFLGRNYLLQPAELGGASPRVSLQTRMELDAAGCETVVSQLAFAVGLVAVALDRERGLWEWINMNGPRRMMLSSSALTVTSAELQQLRASKLWVSVQVQLTSLGANIAAQSLRPFFATSGVIGMNIGTAGSENTVLLAGFADQVAAAVDMIKFADAAAPARPSNDRIEKLEARIAALEAALAARPGK